MAAKLSAKRIAIDKAQLTIIIAAGLGAFIVVFCMVASKSLLEQRAYQAKVITKKEDALDEVKKNASAVKELENSFKAFNSQPANILGGNPAGTGDKDGESARVILDALPSKYDFPALTSSLEKLFLDNGYPLLDISGTDDEVAQSEEQKVAGTVEMPFTATIVADGASTSNSIKLLERSIRPIQVQGLLYKVERNEQPKLTITGKTFYQPSKNFKIETEVVR